MEAQKIISSGGPVYQLRGRLSKKLIAGKDIHFSYSLVEDQNKLIKYYNLLKNSFQNLDDLVKLLDWIVKDYNQIRPHHSLAGLNPFEALTGVNTPQEERKEQLKNARQVRIRVNSEKSCAIC